MVPLLFLSAWMVSAPPAPRVFVEDVKSDVLKAGELEQLSTALCDAMGRGMPAGTVVCEDEERASELTRQALVEQGRTVPPLASARQVAPWRVMASVKKDGKVMRLEVTLMDNAAWKESARVEGKGAARDLRGATRKIVAPLCARTGCTASP